jgi:hypothetical protein
MLVDRRVRAAGQAILYTHETLPILCWLKQNSTLCAKTRWAILKPTHSAQIVKES